MNDHHVSRRDFFRKASVIIGAPYIIPASVLGKNGAVAPSNRLAIASIGMGDRNKIVTGHFLKQQDVQCVAVCDCFKNRRQLAKIMVDTYYGNQDCLAYRFHEEILQRQDIDAVVIATGDRWHAVLSALAAQAGKDVYCEKPFTLTIAEGRALAGVIKRFGTVWQCGTQRRSNDSYRFVADVVHKGLIGKLHTISAIMGDGMQTNGFAVPESLPNPELFDYNRWLGQAPWAPFSRIRVGLWRQFWDMSGGLICDMGPHYFDMAQWGHKSETTGPIEYEGTAVWPDGGLAEVPIAFHVEARYADNIRLLAKNGPKGVLFEGDEGWIHILDDGKITANPESILKTRTVPKTHWSFMGDHVRNFLDCVRTRKTPASHIEIAQRNHTICHCANLCLRLGRKLQWDPVNERFINDDDANNMLSRTMRVPWQI
jgi:predicted dehydrogenase